MTGQFLGQIQQVAFNFAPKGWATCSAQLLAINTNQALFAILGTTYGGNGIQTFGLPDLRGRVAISWGQGPGLADYTLGQLAGSQSVTMLTSNLPAHNHAISVNNQAGNQFSPGGYALSLGGEVSGSQANMYGPSGGTVMSPNTIVTTGNSLPISILQPYTTLQYCVATTGIFPSRN